MAGHKAAGKKLEKELAKEAAEATEKKESGEEKKKKEKTVVVRYDKTKKDGAMYRARAKWKKGGTKKFLDGMTGLLEAIPLRYDPVLEAVKGAEVDNSQLEARLKRLPDTFGMDDDTRDEIQNGIIDSAEFYGVSGPGHPLVQLGIAVGMYTVPTILSILEVRRLVDVLALAEPPDGVLNHEDEQEG